MFTKKKEIFFNKLASSQDFLLTKYLQYFSNFNNDEYNTEFLKRNIIFISKDWILYICFIFLNIRFLQIYHSFCVLSIKKENRNKKEIFINLFINFWTFHWLHIFLHTKYSLYLLYISNFKEYRNCIKIYGIKFFIFAYLSNRLQGIFLNYLQINEEIWFLRNNQDFPFKKLSTDWVSFKFFISLFLQFILFVLLFSFIMSTLSIYLFIPSVKLLFITIFDNNIWDKILNLLFPMFPINPIFSRAFHNVATNSSTMHLSTIKFEIPNIKTDMLLNYFMVPLPSKFLGYFPEVDLMVTIGILGLEHSLPYVTFTENAVWTGHVKNLAVYIKVTDKKIEQQYICPSSILIFLEKNKKFLEKQWTAKKYKNICEKVYEILEKEKENITFLKSYFLWKNNQNNYEKLSKSQYINEKFSEDFFYQLGRYYSLKHNIQFFVFKKQLFLNMNSLKVTLLSINGTIPERIDVKVNEIFEFKKRNFFAVSYHDLEEIQRILYKGYTLSEIFPKEYTSILDQSNNGKNIIIHNKLLLLDKDGSPKTDSGTNFILELSKANNSIFDQRRNVELGIRAGQINNNNIYSSMRFDKNTGKLNFEDCIDIEK